MAIFSLYDRDRFEKLWRVFGRQASGTEDTFTKSENSLTDKEIEDLTDGGETTLHTHAGVSGSVPEYLLFQGTVLDGVDKNISGPAELDTSKMIVKEIRVWTTSTDWEFWLVQNNAGKVADTATEPALQLMSGGNGDESIFVDRPYEDEDGANSINLYFADAVGSASCTVSVVATELA